MSSLVAPITALVLCAAFHVARAAPQTPCDPVLTPGKTYPYGYNSRRGYCEGLAQDDHGSSLQLVQFMATGLIGNSLNTLVVSAPKPTGSDTRPVSVKGLTLMPSVPYHFDATLASGSSLSIDLDAVLKKESVPVESLVYVGTVDDITLVPLALDTKKVDGPLTHVMLGVRVPANVTQLAYRMYPGDQPPSEYHTVDLRTAVNGVCKVLLELPPTKVLRLELRGDIPSQPSQRLFRLISNE